MLAKGNTIQWDHCIPPLLEDIHVGLIIKLWLCYFTFVWCFYINRAISSQNRLLQWVGWRFLSYEWVCWGPQRPRDLSKQNEGQGLKKPASDSWTEPLHSSVRTSWTKQKTEIQYTPSEKAKQCLLMSTLSQSPGTLYLTIYDSTQLYFPGGSWEQPASQFLLHTHRQLL